MYIVHACDTTLFRGQKIPLFIKSLRINRSIQPMLSLVLDQEILFSIEMACEQFPSPLLFKTLYLLAFFSFCRLSNLLPHVASRFDYTRHLCRGDIIFSQDAVIIVVKWSKTLHDRQKVATIAVPYLGESPLCPVMAIKSLLEVTPSSPNNSLFHRSGASWVFNHGVPTQDIQAQGMWSSDCI